MSEKPFAIVDLFAGPGGLAEGFSRVRSPNGTPAYEIVMSVEKDEVAHRTLRLRAFLRQFKGTFPQAYYDWINGGGDQPDWKRLFPEEWQSATTEALCMTLGEDRYDSMLRPRLDRIREAHGDRVILIGGPPCQAYSLVGRARNAGKADYVFEEDHRHSLYKAYVAVLARLRPAAFVMENVKGLLSSKAHGDLLFNRVVHDLRTACGGAEDYELVALTPNNLLPGMPEPRDFVVRAERHGIPQARHRVFIVGIRKALADERQLAAGTSLLDQSQPHATVGHVLGSLPPLRSGLSREDDTDFSWTSAQIAALECFQSIQLPGPRSRTEAFHQLRLETMATVKGRNRVPGRADITPGTLDEACPAQLRTWLHDPRLERLPNHETRSHIREDLARYLFAALHARATGRSPRSDEFPETLAPSHASWSTGKFADRFKVQIADLPSSTVTSHISKDGHYFIHPDPAQCRSLTVREAARLQTFPDNYLFLGNRTQQYVQVGNAVPPLLASQIGSALLRLLVGGTT